MTCLDVCKSATRVIGNHVVGAQKIRNLWRVYTKSRDVRANLLIKGLSLRTKQLVLYDKNPYIHNIRDVNNQKKYTRITIRDIPLSYANDEIKNFLKDTFPSLVVSKQLQNSCERNPTGGLTEYLNGDRFLEVEEDSIDQPLSRNVVIGRWKARIFHYGQNVTKCRICGLNGHKAGTPECAATTENKDTVTVNGYTHILSNFHLTPVEYNGITFQSNEHAYVHTMAIENNLPAEAEKVLTLEHAGHVKKFSKEIEPKIPEDWKEFRINYMEQILIAKFDQSASFRAALAETGHYTIAHSVVDNFWGTGLSPELTMCVDPKYWPGQNMFGRMLAKVRALRLHPTETVQSTEEATDDTSSANVSMEDDSDTNQKTSNETAENQATETSEKSPKTPKTNKKAFMLRLSKLDNVVKLSPSGLAGRRRHATDTPLDNSQNTKAPRTDASVPYVSICIETIPENVVAGSPIPPHSDGNSSPS